MYSDLGLITTCKHDTPQIGDCLIENNKVYIELDNKNGVGFELKDIKITTEKISRRFDSINGVDVETLTASQDDDF